MRSSRMAGARRAGRGRRGAGGRTRSRLAAQPPAALALALCAGALFCSAAAGAVKRPTVSTGKAHEVSYATAVLSASINPNGSDSSYYFQYGLTKAYGGQTAIADAGAGVHTVTVRLPIAGLQPLTVYHYRLVAVNAAGASIGADVSLLTLRVPLTLQILASPNPVEFGGTVVVQGTLSGTGNGNRAVILQANPFPGTGGFLNFGNPELTSASGGFSFPVLGMTQVTQFRVITATSPPVISPVAVENVAVKIESHVGRAGRRHFARIFGTVSPAEDGMQVGILRITHGHGVLVGGTLLHHRDAASSKFSRVVPVSAGVYRVLVRVTTGAQISNYGQPLVIR
jgi:hypothetical protein